MIWLGVGVIGYLIIIKLIKPLNYIIGVPLILVGAGLVINNLADAFSSFDPRINKEVCPFCQKPHKTT